MAPPVGHHLRRLTRQEEGTLGVDREDEVVVGFRNLVDRTHAADAGIEKQDVDTPVLGLHVGHELPDRTKVAGVGGDHLDAVKLATRLLQGLRVRSGHDDRRALLLEAACGRRAHAGRAAAHQSDFAVELTQFCSS